MALIQTKFLPRENHSDEIDHYFLHLNDVPSTFSGNEANYVKVDSTASGLEFSTVDHSGLTGLTIDDHPQYIPTDGSRGFTSTVSGVNPVNDEDLATKSYVDTTITGSIGVGDLPCLQIRRTTDYNLTTSWADVTFNVTDIENNSNIIEHDNTNTDRILVKDDGYYKITYTLLYEPSSTTVTSEARFRKNDTTVISGSWAHVRDSNDIEELSNDFIAYLNSGDFITLQLQTDVSGDIRADLIVTVIRLQGSKGDKGDSGQDGTDGQNGLPGSGSTINILKDDILTASGIGNLNFEGDVSVIDEGGGIATITISGGTGGGVAGDIPTVQARRTTSFNITTSYADVPFNSAAVIETDTTILEHDDANTERIKIKADGLYTILYSLPTILDSSPSAQINVFTQVMKNGSTLIDGSGLDVGYHYSGTYSHSEHTPNNRSVTTQLSSGDYLTLQTKYTESDGPITSLDTNGDVIFKVIKLTGSKGADGVDGAQGPAGSGSTINVYDNGATVSGSPFEVLNFIDCTVSGSPTISGGVDITPSGGGTSVFGSEFQEVSSDGESSTTSSTYQQKLRLTTGTLPSGKYRIGWQFSVFVDATGDVTSKVILDDSTDLDHHSIDNSTDDYNSNGGFSYHSSFSGIHTVDIVYKANSGTALIKHARLEIWRIS